MVSTDARCVMLSYPAGFLVSVTRAKSLLVIIGDPNVLGLDPLWRSFLSYVHHKRGWKGPSMSWDPSELIEQDKIYSKEQGAEHLNMNDFTRYMEELTMEYVEDDPDAGVDRPWRELE